MKIRKTAFGSVAVLAAAATLAACGSAPPKGGPKASTSKYLPCMVSDAGGFDDHSFNQLSYEGILAAGKKLDVTPKTVESNSGNDYAPNLTNLTAAGCNTIVTVGFNLSAATVQSAKANPKTNYVLIDDAADNNGDGKIDAPNIKPMLFDTAQAAFLAGYVAADYTKTGTVGTYGGAPIPTVTIFMDGFKQGVDYYNKTKKKSVKVVGFSGGSKGAFTGGFEANEKATNTAKQIINQNADVILPVGGPIYEGALTAIKDSGKQVALIGVDADLYQTDPNTRAVVLTSIEKQMKGSTEQIIEDAGKGKFDTTPFVGTLKNGGVGLAPFHNFDSKVSPTLKTELDTVTKGIEDGSIKVNSYLAAQE